MAPRPPHARGRIFLWFCARRGRVAERLKFQRRGARRCREPRNAGFCFLQRSTVFRCVVCTARRRGQLYIPGMFYLTSYGYAHGMLKGRRERGYIVERPIYLQHADVSLIVLRLAFLALAIRTNFISIQLWMYASGRVKGVMGADPTSNALKASNTPCSIRVATT